MPRKEKKYHYLYKTTNLLNGKFYIGMHSTNNLDDGYMGSGERLRKSLKKYGKENFHFQIIEMLPDRNSLKNKEKEVVNEQLINNPLCMNLVYGGEGGYISPEGTKKGRKKTDEILKQKYGEDFRKIISKNYYNSLTDQDRQLLTEKIKKGQKNKNFDHGSTFRGKKHTEKSKEKISISKKGKFIGEHNSQFGTCWITNGFENKKINKKDNIPNGWVLGRKIKRG